MVFEGKDGFLLIGLESTYGTFATVSLGAPALWGGCAQNPLFPVRELLPPNRYRRIDLKATLGAGTSRFAGAPPEGGYLLLRPPRYSPSMGRDRKVLFPRKVCRPFLPRPFGGS